MRTPSPPLVALVWTLFVAFPALSQGNDPSAPLAPAGQEAPPCATDDLPRAAKPVPLLDRPKSHRNDRMITGFSLGQVGPPDGRASSGGRDIWRTFMDCTDSPQGARPAVGLSVTDPVSSLTVRITRVEDMGKTGRGWPGVRCSVRIEDTADPARFVEFGRDDVPAFNQVGAIVRDGDSIFVAFHFNGYASEIQRRGNRVVAADLCRHAVVWRSRDLVSNTDLLLDGEYLITGYGFTAEPDFLYVLDRRTGTIVQKLPLPKAPEEFLLNEESLYVRIYDGYAIFPLRKQPRK